jgi:hypothetical protein
MVIAERDAILNERGSRHAPTPNEQRATGPASAAYQEWRERHEAELAQLAERERIAQQQYQIAEHDRWEVVYPLWEASQAAVERRAQRTPVSAAQLAELGFVLGAGYAFVRAAGRKPTLDVLGEVLLGGVVGAAGVYTVGTMWLAVVTTGARPASPTMPPYVALELRGRLGPVEPWRWTAAVESWRVLAAEHNAAHGLGGASPWVGATQIAGALLSATKR